jgi:hypothetical protein
MSDRFDVAARLAEGRPAVQDTQTYVQACHALGYQHPDLTAHDSQIWDWYDTEAGLDLRVLDADTAELRAAVSAIEEVLWLQRAQVSQLATAWTGPGADSATGFLQRHCDAAAEVARRARAAADCCAALGDNLWQMIDGKAATAITIDDRSQAQRSAWLTAAHTVTTRAGDSSEAEELIRQQVVPYVDNDIRVDWLNAMRASAASAATSYDVTIEALTSAPEVCFEVPGDLGPSWQPITDQSAGPSPTTHAMPEIALPPDVAPAAPTVPAAASSPPPPTTEAPQTLSPIPLDNWPFAPPEMATPLGDAADLSTGAGTLGDLGSLGGLAGNIGGVVGKIVDGIGALVGSLADGSTDPSDSGDPLLDDPLDADDPLGADADELADEEGDTEGTDEVDAEPTDGNVDAGVETPAQNPPAPDDAVDEPAAPQVTPPPEDAPPADSPPEDAPPADSPPEDAPPDEAPPEGRTPCEIAADELPQAGQ